MIIKAVKTEKSTYLSELVDICLGAFLDEFSKVHGVDRDTINKIAVDHPKLQGYFDDLAGKGEEFIEALLDKVPPYETP